MDVNAYATLHVCAEHYEVLQLFGNDMHPDVQEYFNKLDSFNVTLTLDKYNEMLRECEKREEVEVCSCVLRQCSSVSLYHYVHDYSVCIRRLSAHVIASLLRHPIARRIWGSYPPKRHTYLDTCIHTYIQMHNKRQIK